MSRTIASTMFPTAQRCSAACPMRKWTSSLVDRKQVVKVFLAANACKGKGVRA